MPDMSKVLYLTNLDDCICTSSVPSELCLLQQAGFEMWWDDFIILLLR